jgi:hypothetical protein
MLKDSVPCPIPNAEKDTLSRPFSEHDITQERLSFNNDPPAAGAFLTLSHSHVAQMTRFEGAGKDSLRDGLRREGFIEGRSGTIARDAAESAAVIRDSGPCGESSRRG